MNYTLGYGLISLLFGIYLIADRDSWARSFASSARWWNRRLGIDSHVHGDREEEQVPYIVMLGVILTVMGGHDRHRRLLVGDCVERRKAEVRRKTLPRIPVNKGKKKGQSP